MRANNGLKAFFLPFLSRLSLSLADVIVTGRLVSGALRSKEKKRAGTAERVAGKGLQGGAAERKKKWAKRESLDDFFWSFMRRRVDH